MKSISIENLYNKIDKKILLVESYTEYKDLSFIIKMSRLKPSSLLVDNKLSLTLDKKWYDEFGNSLNLIKNKKFKIIEDDLSIDRAKIVCSDLYDNLPIHKIAKVSKLVYFLSGKDEDFQEDYLIIAFLGIDNYLRVYYLYAGQLAMCSPLNLGMKVLKSIVENRDLKLYLELNNKDVVLFPCANQKSWVSFWPASKQLLEIISKENELFSQLLNLN